jgi:hypothetical protein
MNSVYKTLDFLECLGSAVVAQPALAVTCLHNSVSVACKKSVPFENSTVDFLRVYKTASKGSEKSVRAIKALLSGEGITAEVDAETLRFVLAQIEDRIVHSPLKKGEQSADFYGTSEKLSVKDEYFEKAGGLSLKNDDDDDYVFI